MSLPNSPFASRMGASSSNNFPYSSSYMPASNTYQNSSINMTNSTSPYGINGAGSTMGQRPNLGTYR